MTISLCAIIPTRNRGLLAAEAARSLLEQDSAVEVYVSDNSTTPSGIEDEFRDESRVTCLRPDREMSPGDHWDWAIGQTMERSRATHFMVMHDRRMVRPGRIAHVEAIASRWPEELITVGTDSIVCHPPPFRLWQMPWTGRVFAMRSSRAAALIASARVVEAVHAMPVLAGCVVPRRVFESIVARFGDICRSIGPDTAFLARFLALHDGYLHFDCATGILHQAQRSTNLGYFRGKGDNLDDLLRLHGDRPWLDAAPLPGVNVGANLVYHEYECVRRETGDRLVPLDRRACLRELARSLRWIDDGKRRAELQSVLRSEGWDGELGTAQRASSWRSSALELLGRMRARFGDAPVWANGYTFQSDREALRWALRHPRRKQSTHEHLLILEPEAVS